MSGPRRRAKPKSVRPRIHGPSLETELSERQAMVLRALVAAFVGQAGPVSSQRLALLMPVPLSSASIRNTLAELHEAGLIAKAHASAGRVPTERGLRVFINDLLELADLGPHRQRLLDRALEGVDAAETPRHASHLLSEHTRQLGFVLAPQVEYQRLRTLHLIPISSERILVVLIAENGGIIERILDGTEPIPRRELEAIGGLLAERVAGRTLLGLRAVLESERDRLRGEADDLLRRAWSLGLDACQTPRGDEDLVIATRLALLDQPEFSDPERIRGLFSALETNQRLLDLLRRIAQADPGGTRVGLSMSLGVELGEPALRDCVLMVAPYGVSEGVSEGASASAVGAIRKRRTGDPEAGSAGRASPGNRALGVLGVIGPRRMDYGQVIPLVSYCSELLTRKLQA
ncbi:MAG TPA: heat-inducible transcriptional repressor HrcA [Deltaproteobacteria bacterium]|nr:heat-inducible transcriptional repressor HrcA [Deltaproteobacteria bacterium]